MPKKRTRFKFRSYQYRRRMKALEQVRERIKHSKGKRLAKAKQELITLQEKL